MDYMRLQNGSDIRGVALEGVPGESVTLDDAAVRHIARGFAAWLRRRAGAGCCEINLDPIAQLTSCSPFLRLLPAPVQKLSCLRSILSCLHR